ncbi:ribonuclease P/MRP protein subunit [Coprinopsis cinerea okayama7|uniref:Ribonuclease P/MRP protein subunit n=1 Tax=Coprinopsis cinerea (strain Okayama-7 / 130 / ATCC MYA-4618 / FGSC 9003) TaxID=240176 RepID=A8NQR7_COPC7|nr:ribonuclease P/MRP protein subunit [Coprinopsis cinerea okayama7\|eukprot:XP_001835663.2 ribonuclease P/MRP protein subunit [Coprinopsis cinerea okayama7\
MSSVKRRKDGISTELSGRDKKKQRMAEAREIPVQAAGPSTPAQTGPAKVVPTNNSLAGLPTAIDVEKFAEARAFEINAMHTAMKSARWILDYPAHKAKYELQATMFGGFHFMDAKPKKSTRLPKRGKSKVVTRTDSFLSRQKDIAWLETHLWHCKRMHMEDIWGFKLATHPTEKAYRPSHRAAVQGSIIHDASYYSLVELRGPENVLVPVLELCCDPQSPSPGSIRFKTGARTLETHVYQPGAYPYDLISPISIIWQPLDVNNGQEKSLPSSSKPTQAPTITSSTQIPHGKLSAQTRCIWLRFHPSAHDEVVGALKTAASQHLATLSNGPEVQIQVTELKDQINVFEFMGPKSCQVLKGALNPVFDEEGKTESKKFWSSLGDVQTSGSLPRNMVVGLKVYDPRLKFPPRNAKPKATDATDLHPPTHIFPSVSLARSELWDESVRLGLAKPRYQKKELDIRRANNPIPGTELKPLRQDDRVPIILVQRSLEAQGDHSTRSESLHGWTVIVPSGWGMAFWNSLIFTGTRVGGQRERQVQAYESGTPYFPRDYIFTSAYNTFSKKREDELRTNWERKPPAKRVNYDKLGVIHPWLPEWNRILGLPEPPTVSEGFVPAEREEQQMDVDSVDQGVKPWLFRGAELRKIVESVSSSFMQTTFLDEINRLRSQRGLGPLDGGASRSVQLLQGALVTVRVTMTSRGTPDDMGIVYSMKDDEVNEELKKLANPKKRLVDPEDEEESGDEEEWPSSDRIIGRITTGHYSLARGGGFAIAAVPLVKMLELKKQMTR